MATQLPHENLNWITNGEPGTGSPDGSTPDGVLNRPIKQNLENIKRLRDTFNEEHTDSGQHETSMLKSKLNSAITDNEIASNAHIKESKIDLLLKGKTRPGGGTYSNSGELADDVLSWVTLRNQVPTRAEFEAFAERVRRAMAGSGFVEWGKSDEWSAWYKINEGMSVFSNKSWGDYAKIQGFIRLGENIDDNTVVGTSRTHYPIVSINGYMLRLCGVTVSIRKVSSGNYGSFDILLPGPSSSPDQLYRQDLVFLECWHEDVSEKDVVFPYGNVQYGAGSYKAPDTTSFSTTLITDLGIAQGYSAFGAWDTETIGKGIKWSSLTEEQKKSFASDPWNNIYVDGDKIIQVRYRMRVIAALDVNGGTFDLQSINPQVGKDSVSKFFMQKSDLSLKTKVLIVPRGSSTISDDFSEADPDKYNEGNGYVFYTSVSTQNFIPSQWGFQQGAFYTNFNINTFPGTCTVALPIALVARRNTGAFHPVYNPNGSALFSGGKKFWEVSIPTPTSYDIVGINIEDTNEDGTNDLFQFIVSGDQTENIKKDYFITVSGSTDNDGRYWVTNVEYDSDNDQTVITVFTEMSSTTADGSLYSDFGYVKYCFDHADTSSGTIESGVSGRPDGLYADEINEGDVKDLRNYAPRVTDYQRVLEKEFNKLISGEMRGWEDYEIGIFSESPYKIVKVQSYNQLNQYGSVFFIEGNPDNLNFLDIYKIPAKLVAFYFPDSDLWLFVSYIRYGYSYSGYGFYVKNDSGNTLIGIWSDGTPLDLSNAAAQVENKTGLTLGDPDEWGWRKIPRQKVRVFLIHGRNKRLFSQKNILWKDVFGFKNSYGVLNICGDYRESFIPIHDFFATVDSTDNTKITISGDKTNAIKKNCRLFFRDSTNNKAGTLRVKTISYDSGNDQTIITTTVESGDSMVAGASVNVSTCVASGQTGEVSEGNQVYVFKLSRKPKNDEVKVLIRKKDGSWFAYNNFDNVNVYNSTSMQSFVNNTGSMDEEIQFNGYLNWLAINISKIYSTLGYSDEDDFKQNVVIETYYVTEANCLSLSSGDLYNMILSRSQRIWFANFGETLGSTNFEVLNGALIRKLAERSVGTEDYKGNGSALIKNDLSNLLVCYINQHLITDDFPSRIINPGLGIAVLPVLYQIDGKLYTRLFYNEVLHDYETDSKGWENAFFVVDYETTSTDANGNTFIAGQKSVELPYFVWTEDK